MRLPSPGNPHLTYCMNVHPGQSLKQVQENISHFVLNVKKLVCPDRPFGVGLWLSAKAVEELNTQQKIEGFKSFLSENDLYVFTLNGFPYGEFHGQRVKEQVYLPDWRDQKRLKYTARLATILAALLPDEPGMEGSISTVPGAFKDALSSEKDIDLIVSNIAACAANLSLIHQRTGKTICLALEPEPCCLIETIDETVAFFKDHIFGQSAVEHVSRLTGLSESDAEEILARHIGVCLDACHMAVEFENAKDALGKLESAGIKIAKVQISTGLDAPSPTKETLKALQPFADDIYFHQVVWNDNENLTRFCDLPEALEKHDQGAKAHWRIHYHVPIFMHDLGPFKNTSPFLEELIACLCDKQIANHLEVETYTWEALPKQYRNMETATAIVKELQWVISRMSK